MSYYQVIPPSPLFSGEGPAFPHPPPFAGRARPTGGLLGGFGRASPPSRPPQWGAQKWCRQATPNNPLARWPTNLTKLMFCIIAGTPPGLCRIHRPGTPQLVKPSGPGLRPGVAPKKRDTVIGPALFWGSGTRPPDGVQNILFGSILRRQPGRDWGRSHRMRSFPTLFLSGSAQAAAAPRGARHCGP